MSIGYKGKVPARPRLKCGPGRTKQSFRDATDINKIVARFERTGLLEHVNKNPGTYADVSNLRDYPSALRLIKRGNDLFDALPSNLRSRFDNDPARLISFLDDPKNKEEAIKLGLLPKSKEAKKPPIPTTPPVVPPVAPSATPPAVPPVTPPPISPTP